MDQDATKSAGRGLVGTGPLPRQHLNLVHAPGADFLSQLIAEREHLPPQRARRRAPVGEALAAYGSGAVIAERRLPPGYRKTIVA